MKKSTYYPELGLAGIEDTVSGIKVFTLTMQPGEKKSAIMAYSGARYSRSIESIETILKEVFSKFGGEGAAKRIESIVQGYGHASVADMSHNMVFIERVPMVTAMRFFYLNPKQDGQERSTRFQDFSNPDFFPCFENEVSEEYEKIMHSQYSAYVKLHDQTKDQLQKFFEVDTTDKKQLAALDARTFDTLRHLIPMGARTNFCAIMSSRDWARYIGTMRGSSQIAEQTVGDLLFELLTGNDDLNSQGYAPESDTLIKYANANPVSEETTENLKKILQNHFTLGLNHEDNFEYRVAQPVNPANQLIDHLCLLTKNKQFKGVNSLNYFANDIHTMLRIMGEEIFSHHNDKKQLGPLFQTGCVMIKGRLDIGALKDFNRHRSLERFIPYLDNAVTCEALFDNGYTLCEYLSLPEMTNLMLKYKGHFDSLYVDIKRIGRKPGIMNIEYLRYLLPHAHSTPFRMYGSLDDMMYVQNLRVRPGGHINYRVEARKWYEAFIHGEIPFLASLWSGLGRKIPTPDPRSREQFLDRS